MERRQRKPKHKHPEIPWSWQLLSQNNAISMRDIDENSTKPWDWSFVSANENVTMSYVLSNLEKPWDWAALSSNARITLRDIRRNPKKPWRLSGFLNPNLTFTSLKAVEFKNESVNLLRNICKNLYGQHPRRRRLRGNSSKRKHILRELHSIFDRPPDEHQALAIFRKGGYGFRESWAETMSALP